LLRQALGEGNVSAYSVKQLIEIGAVSLARPSRQELSDREQQRIDEHNRMLMNADPETLRRFAKEETAVHRQKAVQEQAAREDAARAERDRHQGYQPMPSTFQGQVLDSQFIKKCSAETLKLLIKRFGSQQVTSRLRGES